MANEIDVATIRELQEIKSRSESNSHRLDSLENQYKIIQELSASIQILANNMSGFKQDISTVKETCSKLNDKLDDEIKDIKDDINEVKNQPSRAKSEWFDKILWLIVGGVATAIVTAVIGAVVN